MIDLIVEELIYFAETHLELKDLDALYIKNLIFGELGILTPEKHEISPERKQEIKELIVPDFFVDNLTNYLLEKGFSEKEAENKIVKIFGFLTPLPNQVVNKCNELCKKDSADALNYLYDLSISNYYFQKTKVDKNIVWKTNRGSKDVEISINLSKPEKNNKDIAKLLVKPDKNARKYPECLLCVENLGYVGRSDHPARENIRYIPITLSNRQWYIQYSPYGYFYKHCIIFDKNHDNMHISSETFQNLCEFVDRYPSFFIGANADLPIVGGSILNHSHYQGGKHILPVMEQGVKKEYSMKGYKETKLYLLDWYNTCLLLEGTNKEEIVSAASKILSKWRNYSDSENEIIASDENGEHNTITSAIKKVENKYSLYLILRNNRCNEQYPDGIFHAHPEHHVIKKEGIGIIEAMGLFILPARLIRQFKTIKLGIDEGLSTEEILKKSADLKDFCKIIDFVRNSNDVENSIRTYIEDTCIDILKNTAVFKDDEKGMHGVDKFIEGVNLWIITDQD